MADINWKLITGGIHFEGLVRTLLRFEDPKAQLFGRPGKDGAQDARSGDGSTVYQIKFHSDPTPAMAIRDAKGEYTKIKKYKQPGHSNSGLWAGVKNWVLVSNTAFNSKDVERWKDEVAPLFAEIGLEAEFWGRTDLEAKLVRYPDLVHHYFDGHPRAFLSLPEAQEVFSANSPFSHAVSETGFFGREAEQKVLDAFLKSEQHILVFHGPGGIGKSRLLLALGEHLESTENWQVLWANVATMEHSDSWLRGLIRETSTLFLIDEPESEALLRVLTEQLAPADAPMHGWKVVIAVRSPKDPILQYLGRPGISQTVMKHPLETLEEKEARRMCDALLAGRRKDLTADQRAEISKVLADRFDRHPIWMEFAVDRLGKDGDLGSLPKDASALADLYLEEIYTKGGSVSDEIRDIMRWVALLGTCNRESATHLQILMEGGEIAGEGKVLAILKRLVDRRALFARGIKDRMVEIKPDVIRDHILKDWLVADVDFGENKIRPSDGAKGLVEEIIHGIEGASLTVKSQAALEALARTEVLLTIVEDKEVPLVKPVFSGILERVGSLSAAARVLAIESLTGIAYVHPREAVAISKALRENPATDQTEEGLYGTREIGQADVVEGLAWFVYHAAVGARDSTVREAILRELLLVGTEELKFFGDSGFPNDGKRAEGRIARVLAGGREFQSEFDEEAGSLAMEALEKVGNGEPEPEYLQALSWLLKAVTSMTRERTWREDYTLQIQTIRFPPSSRPAEIRDEVLQEIRRLLEGEAVSEATRILLWGVLEESKRDADHAARPGDADLVQRIRDEDLNTLRWMHGLLEGRDVSLVEIKAARKLWHWHLRYDKDEEVKAEAENLEIIFNQNSLVAEFNSLVEIDLGLGIQEERAKEKAEELLKADTKQEIKGFLERAAKYFAGNDDLNALWGVAVALGEGAPENEGAREFVFMALAKAEFGAEKQFAISVVFSWIWATRKASGHDAAFHLVHLLLKKCGNDETRVRLLASLYRSPTSVKNLDEYSAPEIEWLRSEEIRDLFVGEGVIPSFLEMVGWTILHDWVRFKETMEQVLSKTHDDTRTGSVAALFSSVYRAIRTGSSDTFPDGIAEWLLDQMVEVYDLGDLNDVSNWHLEEILKKAGKPSLDWLGNAVGKRMDDERHRESGFFKVLCDHPKLTQFVRPVEEAEAQKTEFISTIDYFLDLLLEHPGVEFYLPDYLIDLDPNGFMVPGQIVERIGGGLGADDEVSLATVGGRYKIGTQHWRTIATAVIEVAGKRFPDDKPQLFYHLCREKRMESWVSAPGEVPEHFIQEVEGAKHFRDNESDPKFMEFWEWLVQTREATLSREKERIKEGRGE